MHTTNSSGRRVSLLNDEPSPRRHLLQGFLPGEERETQQQICRSGSYNSEGSSPRTPDLFRADSYDSRRTNDPASPATPSLMDFGRNASYSSTYPDPTQYEQRPYGSYSQKTAQPDSSNARSSYTERAANSFEDDRSIAERTLNGKRYPCRFKDSHGCDKTFTTSGHASRHSKIHTAEKCVQCSFQGCHKKFTRADNMKQHLETHYKERSRASASVSGHKAPSSSSSASKLTLSAGVKKVSSRTSRPPSRNGRVEVRPEDTVPYVYYAASASSVPSPGPSPVSTYGSLDMGGFRRALPTGLDALVDAVEFQSRS